MTNRPRYEITVQDAVGDNDREAIVRLRRMLKWLLRSWSFRCISIREVRPDQASPDALAVRQGDDGRPR